MADEDAFEQQKEIEDWPERADDFVVQLYRQSYKTGLIHGFTLGKGKPPRPEDMRNIDAMCDRVVAAMTKRLKNASNETEQT